MNPLAGCRLTLAQLVRACTLPAPHWTAELRAVFWELLVLELAELLAVAL